MVKILNEKGKKQNTIYIDLDSSLEETDWLHNIRNRYMENGSMITSDKAKEVGNKLRLNWNDVDINEFTLGLNEELEHKDVTGGDLKTTAKIALAHLKEDSRYYTKLKKTFAKENIIKNLDSIMKKFK